VAFNPKVVISFLASLLFPLPDSRIPCASVIDAGILYSFCFLIAISLYVLIYSFG